MANTSPQNIVLGFAGVTPDVIHTLCETLVRAQPGDPSADAAVKKLISTNWSMEEKLLLAARLGGSIGMWEFSNSIEVLERLLTVAGNKTAVQCNSAVLQRLQTYQGRICAGVEPLGDAENRFVQAIAGFYEGTNRILAPIEDLAEYLRTGSGLADGPMTSLAILVTSDGEPRVPMSDAIEALFRPERLRAGSVQSRRHMAERLVSSKDVAFWARVIPDLNLPMAQNEGLPQKSFLEICFDHVDPILLAVMHSDKCYLALRKDADALDRTELSHGRKFSELGFPMKARHAFPNFQEPDALEIVNALSSSSAWVKQRVNQLPPVTAEVIRLTPRERGK